MASVIPFLKNSIPELFVSFICLKYVGNRVWSKGLIIYSELLAVRSYDAQALAP